MSTAEVDFDTILQKRNRAFYLINNIDDINDNDIKSEYLVVDLDRFVIKRMRLGKEDAANYVEAFDFLIIPFDEDQSNDSLLSLCKMKIYYLGLELFLPINEIQRICNIWVSWVSYLPIQTSMSLLRIDASGIFASILNN